MLGTSLLFLFIGYFAKEEVTTRQDQRPSSLKRYVYRKSLYGSFSKAIKELAYIRWALVDPPLGALGTERTGTWKQENQRKIQAAISNVKEHVAMIEESWKESALYHTES